MNCEEARPSLDAYVDGELELTRQLAIENHLATCPPCQEAANRIATCSLLIRKNMPAYKAPAELRSKVLATLRKEDRPDYKWFTSHRRQIIFAAALIVLSCTLAWSWLSSSSRKEHGLIAEAISNHSRSLMVSHLVDCASNDQHTVRPWFNGKLDYAPPVPDLSQAGYTLVGGRIDMLEQRSVAAVVYLRGKHVINLFVWPASDQKIDLEVSSERGYHFCGWNKARLNFFCISEISAADLEAFEDEVRENVNL
jgi:anti-sigma factor RsiW